MEINFSQIRSHAGSKNSGFEELICQLAHLQRLDNRKRFVKKEGDGGDAGVECYWILDDGTEICWQAKYFLDGMNSSRWQQLDDSFTTALEKHPNLKHYVVCLPLDKADSRKTGRGGKKVVSVEDEWLERVKKWKQQAKAVDREIEFSYWGKHEIINFLTIDDPLYSGKALYWFNEPFIGKNAFQKILNSSKISLGDRYTPDFHVELPIMKKFDGLSLDTSWWELLRDKRKELKKAGSEIVSFFKKEIDSEATLLNTVKIDLLESQFNSFLDKLTKGILNKSFHTQVKEFSCSLDQLSKIFAEVYEEAYEKIDWTDKRSGSRTALPEFSSIVNEFKYFLKDNVSVASQKKAALLYGEAGIGKSHLLCDLSLNRINSGLPTLFLLGAQYQGGNPVNLIREKLDLQNHSYSQVLGAIDAAGEASGTRALIVIDAINEGGYRDEWHDHLASFLYELSYFPNIAVLLSCRSTYLNYILPENFDEESLPRIEHHGFRGHEHRAAEQYLSKQGISKPSSPILAPEFSNPLFLKTCCKALKQSQLNSFPKGLNSITSLFKFYINSIERVVAKKKRYKPQENIINSVLMEIASKLLPNNLEGLPIQKVRELVNSYDPNPNVGDSLFEVLMDEGILAEDVSYKDGQNGALVVRFTYERFSDYFIAKDLIARTDNIELAFSKGGAIWQLIKDNGYYRFSGVFEALAIIIAESFNKELEDLLPKEFEVDRWQLDETFQNTILWRGSESFSERTLEILNRLQGFSFDSPALDILLKLSTEPNHPWNATLLHRNLIGKGIAERDHFWSVYIAFGDSSEEDNEHESIVRTIIEWSYSGEIESVEEERIRLCAITLIWFLTTPNRKVRDRATKSLVRILSSFPHLIVGLLDKFSDVNDTYLIERLYAVGYGVVCNISQLDIIQSIATKTFELVFESGKPMPHILLRDYARGILELALHLEILPNKVKSELFRPPYSSNEELRNPTQEEVDQIIGDKVSSSIEGSLMGFPGDFGNYTMGCVHNWSSTSISSSVIESGLDVKRRFASEFLTGDLQEEYLKRITPVPAVKNKITWEELQIKIISSDTNDYELRKEEQKKFDNKINSQLSEEQQEYYRWLSGLTNDQPAAFSRKWAQRWVCKRAYEFGWTAELFADFEKRCSYGRGAGLGSGAMERVGKKYQWMAFHEFLARLSDNYHWINRGYSDVPDDDNYEGPWQINKRDIDPTIWAKYSGEYKTYHNKQCTWWQPYSFPFPNENSLTAKMSFLWSEKKLPDFSELLKRTKPFDNSDWLVLRGFWNENKKYLDGDVENPDIDGWFRINAIFIRKGDYDLLEQQIKNKNLCDPHIINVPSTQYEGFLGEYPWHTIYSHLSGWKKPKDSFGGRVSVEHFVPFSKYEWESGSNDYSINSSLNFHLPAKELIQNFNLTRPAGQWGRWEHKGQLVFCDPSLEEYGPSYALMRADILQKWLDDNDMEIVWLIGGEKQMFSFGAHQFFGRLIYSGLFRCEDGKPVGNIWFEQEKPEKH